MRAARIAFLCIAVAFSASVTSVSAALAEASSASDETGLAAVYTDKLRGHKTASGHRYDPQALTAAHKTLPFGTHARVTNPANGKSVEVTIDDRGPTQAGRILDLSAHAARELGIHKFAMAEVKLEVVGSPSH